jgi:hypothetical protein
MSRQRNAREALAQDQLTQAASFGLQMQRQDLSERQFAAQIAQASYGLVKEQQTEDARVTLSQQLSSIDPMSPDAPDRVREVQSRYQGVLPASEFRNLFDPVSKQVEASSGYINTIRTEIGVNPVVGQDGRYDLAATRQVADEIKAAYAQGLNPLVRGALDRSPEFANMSTSEKLEYGQRHQKAEELLDWALANDLVAYEDVVKGGGGIYLNAGSASSMATVDGASRLSGSTSEPVRADHIFDLRAVQGLKTKDGRALGAAFTAYQRNTMEVERSNKGMEVAGTQLKALQDSVKVINQTLSTDAGVAGLPPKTQQALLERLDSLNKGIAELEGQVLGRGAVATGATPSGLVQPMAQDLDRKAHAQAFETSDRAELAAVTDTISMAANKQQIEALGGTVGIVIEVDGKRVKVVE